MVPTIGPSMRPMPPITVMKITKAVQSLTLKAASGRDAQLLQEDQRADHGGAERGDDVDEELDARDVDAVAARRELVVADRLEREAVARAQQQHDQRRGSATTSASAIQ